MRKTESGIDRQGEGGGRDSERVMGGERGRWRAEQRLAGFSSEYIKSSHDWTGNLKVDIFRRRRWRRCCWPWKPMGRFRCSWRWAGPSWRQNTDWTSMQSSPGTTPAWCPFTSSLRLRRGCSAFYEITFAGVGCLRECVHKFEIASSTHNPVQNF